MSPPGRYAPGSVFVDPRQDQDPWFSNYPQGFCLIWVSLLQGC